MGKPKVYNNPNLDVLAVHLSAHNQPLCWDGMSLRGDWQWSRDLRLVGCQSCLDIVEYERRGGSDFHDIDDAIDSALEVYGHGAIKMLVIVKGGPREELTQLRSAQAYIQREIEKLEGKS